MNSTAKVLIPNREWLIRTETDKIGSITKNKKGYSFIRHGKQVAFKNLEEINSQFGITFFEGRPAKSSSEGIRKHSYSIYDFACNAKPYDSVYDVKRKLPLFTKNSKSKSKFCAGYYIVKFKKGWVKTFCPKLITLERYPYHGPFKYEEEMKEMFNLTTKK